ncbi:MAG: hypothetical protein OK422_04665 [Thaumarchaeota archaeon]|nr:hypothetical protein [Nitrososphaerota archaeon]
MTLSRESAQRVSILYEIAKSNGSLMTLPEVLPLLPEQSTERELEEAIESSTALSSRYEVKSGYLTEKIGRDGKDDTVSNEVKNRRRATSNLVNSQRFVGLLSSRNLLALAVSGSTAYRSAGKSEDLDLFCVTQTQAVWIFLVKSLLIARISGLVRRGSPRPCLSYVMDAKLAVSMFREKQDMLFARDALEAVVLEGENVYRDLLRRAYWMSAYFPTLYASKMTNPEEGGIWEGEAHWTRKVLNRLLFVLVGRFITLKSRFLNRRLSEQGNNTARFRILAADDHLILESVRYAELRQAYSQLATISSPAKPPNKNGTANNSSTNMVA